MSSEADYADRLFGGQAASKSPMEQPSLSHEDEIANRFYGTPERTAAPASRGAGEHANKSDVDMAHILFGGPAEKLGEPIHDSAPRTEEQAAEALFGDKGAQLPDVRTPQAIREARAADAERKMFSPQNTFAEVIRDDMFDDDEDAHGLSAEVRQAAVNELREMAADLGMSTADVREFREVGIKIKESPPTDDQRLAWREEAVSLLNAEFGNGAARALKDARAFIAADPRWTRMLEERGGGDHPQVVLKFARLARQARAAGRLK